VPPSASPVGALSESNGTTVVPGAPLDYEAVYCDASVPADSRPPLPRALSFTTTLRLRDSALPPTSYAVRIVLVDQPEATVLAPADNATTAALALANPAAPTNSTLLLDDGGADPPTEPRFIVCTQDANNSGKLSSLVRFSDAPLEGAAALPSGRAVSDFFDTFSLSVAMATPLPLSALPGCLQAFRAAGAARSTVADLSGAVNPGTGYAYAQAFTLRAKAGARAIPARALTLQLWGVPGEAGDAPPLLLRVHLTRSYSGIPPQYFAATVFEKLPVGTVVTNVTLPSSLEQDFRFSVDSLEWNVSAAYFPSNLFEVKPVQTALPIYDAATGRASVAAVAQHASVVVARDSLDLTKVGPCEFKLTILATGTGDFSATQSLLPPRVSLPVIIVVIITVARLPADATRAVSTVRAPPGGLSASGGDLVDIFGAGLGLPDSPFPPLLSSFTDGANEFRLRSCAISTRMTAARCTTSAGWSNRSAPALSVLAVAPTEPLRLSTPLVYAPPQALAVAPSPTSLQLASWVALLSLPQPFSGNATASLSSPLVLPPPPGAWHDAPLPPLVQPAAGLSQRNFSLLLGNAAAPLAPSLCLSVAVALLLEDTTWALPLGFCEADAAATAALRAAAGGSSALGSLSANTTAASAAVFNCPAPPLSGGAWRAVGAYGEVVAAAFAPSRCAWAPWPLPARPLPLAQLAPPFRAAVDGALQRVAGGAPPPNITALSQSGLSFTLTGTGLGAPNTATPGDSVEYAAGAPCATAAPCAVLRARGCLYSGASSITCSLDPEGWGAGLRVRVVVGGQASRWWAGAPLLSYPAPAGLSVEVLAPPGAAPAAVGSLPGAGGGLLLLRGDNLWPHRALRLKLGGVLLVPIDLRPLAAAYPAAAHNTSCAAAAAAGRLGGGALGCFGGSGSQAWPPPAPPSGAAVLFSTPPGFGNVSLLVQKGNGGSWVPVPGGAVFAQPRLTSVSIAKQELNTSTGATRYTLDLQGSMLSPCYICFTEQRLAPDCRFFTGRASSSPAAAAAAETPVSGSGEGALPAPLALAPSDFSACARPDNASAFTARVMLEGSAVSVESATFNAPAERDVLRVTTTEPRGNFTLSLSMGASPVFPPARLLYDQLLLTPPFATTVKVDPLLWPPGGWAEVTLTVLNTAKWGFVRAFSDALPCPITCPILPNTSVAFTGDDGTVTTNNAATLFSNGTAAAELAAHAAQPLSVYLKSVGGGRTWDTLANATVPCFVTHWEGAASPGSARREVRFSSPAWVGSLRVGVESNGFIFNALPAATAAPIVCEKCATAPAGGDTSAGGGNLSLSGANFGRLGSLGALWLGTGAAVLQRALAPSAECPVSPNLGNFSVQLVYPLDKSTTAPRACPVRAWSDGNVTCTLPEGVAGSVNSVQLFHQTAEASGCGAALRAALLGGYRSGSCVPAGGVPATAAPLTTTLAASAPFTYQPWRFSSSIVARVALPPGLVPAEWAQWGSSGVATVRGEGLSRFTLSRFDEGANATLRGLQLALAGLSGAGATAAGPPDAAGGGLKTPYFYPYILLCTTGARGKVNGGQALQLESRFILSLDHTAVTFLLPLVEGRVNVALRFASSDGTVAQGPQCLNSPALATADPPLITSIETYAADPAVDDVDPCAALLAHPPPKNSGQCINASRALWPAAEWGPDPLVPPPLAPREPCVRAQLSSGAAPPQLVIRGTNFGSGDTTDFVFIVPDAYIRMKGLSSPLSRAKLEELGREEKEFVPWVPDGLTLADVLRDEKLKLELTYNTRVQCQPVQGAYVRYSPTSLNCTISDRLPRGNVTVYAAVAFDWLSSAASGYSLRAACPCGTFATGDPADPRCKACEEGAVCAGAFQPPRAASGYWETELEGPFGWRSRFTAPSVTLVPLLSGGLRVFTAGSNESVDVAPFVKCPSPALCLGAQMCLRGASGWACSECDAGYARGYDGLCTACDRGSSVALVVLIVVGVPALFYLAVRCKAGAALEARLCPGPEPPRCAASVCLCMRVRVCPCWRGYYSRDPASGGPLVDRSGAPREPEPIQWRVVAKVLLTFMQTFGALASFTSSSRLRREFRVDFKLLPNVLSQLRVFADMGLSAAYFKCAGALEQKDKVLLYMLLPLGPLLLLVAMEAYERVGRARLRWGGGWVLPPLPQEARSFAVFLEVLLVPVAVAGLARAQDCMRVEYGGFLNEAPSVSCYEAVFRQWQLGAKWVGYLYLLVVLCVCVALACGSRRARTWFSFMLEGYKDDAWGRSWEAVALLRKSALLGIPTGFAGLTDGRTQVSFTLMLLTLTLSLHIIGQPFKQAVMNDLDFLSLVAAIAVALSVSTRVSAAMSKGYGVNAWEQLFFDATALALCVPFVLFWAFLIVDNVLYDGYMVVAARLQVAQVAARLWIGLAMAGRFVAARIGAACGLAVRAGKTAAGAAREGVSARWRGRAGFTNTVLAAAAAAHAGEPQEGAGAPAAAGAPRAPSPPPTARPEGGGDQRTGFPPEGSTAATTRRVRTSL
jgi:hypothetical protein